MRKSFKIILISLCALLLALGVSYFLRKETKAVVRLNSTTIQIDKFAICRNVVNPTAQAIMIPIGSREEWCSFIQNAPSLGIVLERCQICERKCRCSNCWTMRCRDYNFNPCPAG